MSQTISVADLRVGMYVHLDLRWWAHPFALSSFLITTPSEIEQIRALGLKQVRWSASRSRLQTATEPAGATVGAMADADAGEAADAAEPGESPPQPDAPTASRGDAAQRRRRELLAEQRRATRRCLRQYGEAAQAWTEIVAAIGQAPVDARKTAEATTRALLDKMLGDQDMCIRMISEGVGDRSTLHALNVTVIAMLMARRFDFGADAIANVGVGAMLHDIGKLELPARLRHADPAFTSAELSMYRSHVPLGIAQGQRMGLAAGVMAVIAQHHEFTDGSGFPGRLTGESIDPASRIVALVDRFDNLCNPLLPHQALTPHEAVSLMFAQNKNKFDVTMLGAFIRMMGVYPPGSVVQLTDGRYGLVVGVNSSRPLKPRVLVHEAGVAADEALVVDLEGDPDLGIRRSLKPSAIPGEAQEYLSPRQRIAYFFEPHPPLPVAESVV